MGLEITRKKDGSPRSKWWYGRFNINGKSTCVNLGVKIAGRFLRRSECAEIRSLSIPE